MKTFRVVRGDRRKTVKAMTPLSACKKAFRAPPMTRWESIGDEAPDSALVFQGRTPVAICNLYDNGTGGQP